MEPDAQSSWGARVRRTRLERRLSVRRLAELAGVSPSYISQFERGLTGARLESLLRISGALGVPLADMFAEEAPRVTARRLSDAARMVGEDGYQEFLLNRWPLTRFDLYVGHIRPGQATSRAPYRHGDAQELLLVQAGSAYLELGEQVISVEAHEYVEYRSSVPHRVVHREGDLVEVLWVISPPTSGREHAGDPTLD